MSTLTALQLPGQQINKLFKCHHAVICSCEFLRKAVWWSRSTQL